MDRHCYDTKTALDSKTYQKAKLQDLPEGYIWVNDILVLEEKGCTYDKGGLREELFEVKVSRKVLKRSRLG